MSPSYGNKIRIKELVAEGLHLQIFQLYKDELHCLHGADVISILPSIIKSCSTHHFHGLQLHCTALKSASTSDIVVSNSLISMYAKLSLVGAARKVFDEMPKREGDTITWNSIVNCYLQNGDLPKALGVLKDQMHLYGGFSMKPELIASIVSLCARKREYRIVGRQIHGLVVVNDRFCNEEGEESVLLSMALVDLYMRCHDTSAAFHVFRNMNVKNEVSWTAMISGCVVNQCYGMAMNCLREMQVPQGLIPNWVTVLAILPACTELGNIRHGKEIHAYSFRHGFESDPHCSAALINMYCKCGKDIRPAKLIFNKIDLKDVIIWSSMIGSYSQCGDSVKAMKLFSRMRAGGIKLNSVTLLASISACTSLSSLQIGGGVHSYFLKYGFNSDIFIGNALINMYAKCGSLTDSHEIFTEMASTDYVSWSTMIESYALHGRGYEALKLFLDMQDRGIEPDAICFLSVLSACNHAGLLEEGKKIFEQMVKDSNVTLSLEHYAY